MPAGVSDNPFLKIESLLKLTQVTLSQGLKAHIPYFGRQEEISLQLSHGILRYKHSIDSSQVHRPIKPI